ncbi:hypothetical protein BKA60DRAFT_327915 [Fusarium oxysporum]|nr:hypothetical protein BKA60DRAFT_327915 [Fusarium oxysporum]
MESRKNALLITLVLREVLRLLGTMNSPLPSWNDKYLGLTRNTLPPGDHEKLFAFLELREMVYLMEIMKSHLPFLESWKTVCLAGSMGNNLLFRNSFLPYSHL